MLNGAEFDSTRLGEELTRVQWQPLRMGEHARALEQSGAN